MLAIVIPYYKSAFFKETLQSLAEQTDKRFHVYIGDDASPEPCLAMLEKYRGEFEFTFERFEDNLGATSLVKQWERCIDMVQDEEWVMILGDDDVLGDNVVEEFYNSMALLNNSVIIRFSSVVINERSNIISKRLFHEEFENPYDSFIRKILKKNRSSLSEYIFKINQYRINGFSDYPLAWHTDDKAWIDFNNGKKIFTNNKALVMFRYSTQNISNFENFKNEKFNASYLFYKDLVFLKLKNFSIKQKCLIISKYEFYAYKSNKLSFIEYLKILLMSVSVCNFPQLLRMCFRIIKRKIFLIK